MTIGYLGPTGSFTETAARKAFPESELSPYPTISKCLKASEDGDIEYAVVPIENTIEGTVNMTIDYIYHHVTPPVQMEVILPIAHQLMMNRTNTMSTKDVKKILSHPQALAQCQSFLELNFPHVELEATLSTAYAAKYVSEHPEEAVAAIGPELAATAYDLEIHAKNIQDLAVNKTRFWVMGNSKLGKDNNPTPKKASLCFRMEQDSPGALTKILSTLSWRDINLCKVESRPLKTILGDYFFLLDIIVDKPIELLNNAMEEMQLLGAKTDFLGMYSVKEFEEI